ncbi:Protein alcS [Pseudocercospora fuligena]|uniref:Protein alcS n=1 Tax=Pseudocercospora fuligena TaxID=685502 RepID=A0A8H6RTY2_9PEZI|nr:Protein alcS [Pseudocercospora fuligena]
MSSQVASNYNATQENANLTAPNHANAPMEKDFENGYHLDNNMDPGTALRKIQTSGSISISPELFEKIYLSPQNKVSGDLRKTFGNPTPLALCGFLLSLTPLSCDLMGWRGAGGNGAASTGVYFFFGGLLMILGSLGEFILGNTFPFVVFGSFGAFWLAFAATLQPFYNAYGAYSTDASNPAEGLETVGFNASFAFFLLFMGVLCFLYMILALRTNLIFFLIFMTLVPAFGLLAAAYWNLAKGTPAAAASAKTYTIAAGALTFVTDMLGWWIFFAILLASLDFPFQLPVVDLSRFVKGASDKKKAKEYEA